jgi:hypothetical protein
MNKIALLFLSFAALSGIALQSCSDSETYAEQLEKERVAINKYIGTNLIKVITEEDFKRDTLTDVALNEYVALSNGVYMQIVDRGSELAKDTIKANTTVLIRFMEYDVMALDTTISNIDYSLPDGFRYDEYGTTAYATFLIDEAGIGSTMYAAYSSTQVPNGWLLPLKYIRSKAHIRLIVPSKMGHSIANQYVNPFYYDIRRLIFD